MIRYTTPWHYFRFPDNPETYPVIEIAYQQNSEVLLVKEKSDLFFYNAGTEEEPVYVGKYRLTQEETAFFDGTKPEETQKKSDVYIQVRALDATGNALASKPHRVKVRDVLHEGVLNNAP